MVSNRRVLFLYKLEINRIERIYRFKRAAAPARARHADCRRKRRTRGLRGRPALALPGNAEGPRQNVSAGCLPSAAGAELQQGRGMRPDADSRPSYRTEPRCRRTALYRNDTAIPETGYGLCREQSGTHRQLPHPGPLGKLRQGTAQTKGCLRQRNRPEIIRASKSAHTPPPTARKNSFVPHGTGLGRLPHGSGIRLPFDEFIRTEPDERFPFHVVPTQNNPYQKHKDKQQHHLLLPRERFEPFHHTILSLRSRKQTPQPSNMRLSAMTAIPATNP